MGRARVDHDHQIYTYRVILTIPELPFLLCLQPLRTRGLIDVWPVSSKDAACISTKSSAAASFLQCFLVLTHNSKTLITPALCPDLLIRQRIMPFLYETTASHPDSIPSTKCFSEQSDWPFDSPRKRSIISKSSLNLIPATTTQSRFGATTSPAPVTRRPGTF